MSNQENPIQCLKTKRHYCNQTKAVYIQKYLVWHRFLNTRGWHIQNNRGKN